MSRKSLVIVGVLASLSLRLFADDATVNRRKAETIVKADKLFGHRYAVGNGKPLRYDKQTEGYLIGAKISAMSDRNRELFEEYLRELSGT